ncbi:hypothetical protein GTP58_24440 [Duganella sp. CY15W]|uniref:HK97-gp10 family putative phage morphogenesis protein n=1 Tax=Duganella sp. CY15W TaxID=2692172 RepID=UPI00136C2DE6|nr:HK97-gp10 family putative phage morphogenesis protein [Duganella sp. CY15W]MYM31487.1 hypothetical protein [Duganella sp. CY15W]
MSDETIVGGRQLDAFLQSLPAKVEANILRSALRAGANVFKDEIKATIPVQLGELQRSVRVSTSSNRGTVTAKVKVGNEKAWYWRFVEFGTAAHRIGPKNAKALALAGVIVGWVHHPGARPKPFMRPAFDGRSGTALEAVGTQIRARLASVGINASEPEAS